MIQLNNNERIIENEDLIDALKQEYLETNCFVIHDLVSASLKQLILNKMANGDFNSKLDHASKDGRVFAKEYILDKKNPVYDIFRLLMNDDDFLSLIKSITGLKEICRTTGRIYKFENSSDCYDSWHNDITPEKHRLLGFSINLSEATYEGGLFSLREKATKTICRKIKHTSWGSTHFFRIDTSLEHKVDSVTGKEPRVVYAGWFLSRGKLADCISTDSA